MRRRRCVQRKLCNFRATVTRQSKQASESEFGEVSVPGYGLFIPLGSLPGRLFPRPKSSIGSHVRLGGLAPWRCHSQPRALRLGASRTSSTPISRALHAPTSHKRVRPRVVNNHIKFISLRESSDSANRVVSAATIQLTPKP